MNLSVGNTSLKPQAKGEEWDPWGMEGGAPEVPGSWDDLDTAKVHKLIDYDLVLESLSDTSRHTPRRRRINPKDRTPNYS